MVPRSIWILVVSLPLWSVSQSEVSHAQSIKKDDGISITSRVAPHSDVDTVVGLSINANGEVEETDTVPRSELRQFPGVAVEWRVSQRLSENKTCGVNAMFAYLSWHGVHVTLLDLKARFGVSENGIDMLRLQEVASEYGVASKVVECHSESLDTILPAIILHDNPGMDIGHFTFLTSLTNEGYSLIEPSSCRAENGTRDAFESYGRYSGYALVANRSTQDSARWVHTVLASVICLEIVLIGLYRRWC